MKFALNYSPQAAELVDTGRIDIDYFKTPPWPDMIQEASQTRPVAVHFELDAGPGLTTEDLAGIETILEQTATPHVNLHLDAKSKHFENDLQLLTRQDRQEIVLERLIADVQFVVNAFGAGQVIVENVPYRGSQNSKKLAESSNPEVINAVVRATGCGLLLDIAHARISAGAIGIDAEEYLSRLPTDSLRELHTAGVHTLDSGRRQDHLPMLPEDWNWLDRVLVQINQGLWPEAFLLAFEYGGTGPFFGQHTNPLVLAEQVPRLAALVRNTAAPA